jgi:hypothetical protein
MCLSVSLGVHPPCRRGSVGARPKESLIDMPCNSEELRAALPSAIAPGIALDNCSCIVLPSPIHGLVPPASLQSCRLTVSESRYPISPLTVRVSNSGGFNQQEFTKLSGDMEGVRPGTFANRMFAPERHMDVLERVPGCTPPMSPRIDWHNPQRLRPTNYQKAAPALQQY